MSKIPNDDPAMLVARSVVEAHILHWGMVPHPDYLKEAIAAAIQRAVADALRAPT